MNTQTFTDETITKLAAEIDKAMGKKDPNAAGVLLELHRQNKKLRDDIALANEFQEFDSQAEKFAQRYAHLRQPGNCIIHVKATQQEWGGVTQVAYTTPEQLDQTVDLAIKITEQAGSSS